MVAAEFDLDPVAVLDESDPLKADVRIAAYNVVQDEQRKAHARSRSK